MSAAIRLLAGKTAAITGGTTGIGRAITLEYLRQGANVAVNHLGLSKDEPLRQSLLDEAKRLRKEAPEGAPTGELLEIAGDVTNPETGKTLVAEAVSKWGALDVFVANAGIFKASKFLDIEKDMFDDSMKVNVNGAFYACQAAAKQMVKQGKGGSIIGISSISALVGGGLQVHYTPTKAALLSMTQSMAIALAKDKIRVNALLPGTIHTQLADADMANEEKRKYLEHRIPWGRVERPEDLAGPAVFLASDKMSGFVTGAQLLVDGGILPNMILADYPKFLLLVIPQSLRRTPQRFVWRDSSTSARPNMAPVVALQKLLTCRRRHVKCDERKPRCGGCVRKKAACEYSSRRQGTDRATRSSPEASGQNDKVDSRDSIAIPASAQDEVEEHNGDGIFDATEPMSPASNQPEQENQRSETVEEGQGTQVSGEAPPQTADDGLDDEPGYSLPDDTVQMAEQDTRVPDMNHSNSDNQHSPQPPGTNLNGQACYRLHNFPHSHPLVQEMLSPTQLHFQTAPFAYHSTPDSGASHGAESLTLKWLDLLIGDATLNYGPLPELDIDPNGPNIFGNSAAQTPVAIDEAATPVANNSWTNGTSATTRHSYLQERVPDKGGLFGDKKLWQASEPISLLPQEHLLLRHFTENISRWMDLFEPQRPFGTLVPHLALHNIGLMNAILALSARHLSAPNYDAPSYATSYRPDTNDTIGYYWKTLHYSQKAMEYDTYQTSLELLASAIIISSYEMLDGSSTDWEKHLKGVFWIQRSQVIHGDSGGLRQAVWWAWLCQDVWAAFREKRKPFTFWQPTRTLAELNPNQLAARAVYNFAHVVGFCAEESGPDNATGVAVKTHEATLLMQQLHHWKSYLTVEFNPLPLSETGHERVFPAMWIQPAAFGVAMQLYYCSLILLHLHRPSYGGYKEYLERQKTLNKWARMVIARPGLLGVASGK
ncbi:hypothetical protein FALBO_7347 [Fusarium albosuccineum]|uniref:Zn(2)-C6 fungal-type domain-containing protein n=1 Tax=Fusarium albosuccineum TaxID=1237068 RepID=A0A8H4LBL5_9HYPO|nr:hypothetical protein FALBO_7347 [Fusarium albosuccineum]